MMFWIVVLLTSAGYGVFNFLVWYILPLSVGTKVLMTAASIAYLGINAGIIVWLFKGIFSGIPHPSLSSFYLIWLLYTALPLTVGLCAIALVPSERSRRFLAHWFFVLLQPPNR